MYRKIAHENWLQKGVRAADHKAAGHKIPPSENWIQKGVHLAEDALKMYGTARGVYEAGSALATGLSSAYRIAAPALAML